MPNTQWFRARARELYHVEGEVEIDEKARVSRGGTDGAYVQAWVWVPYERAKPTALADPGENLERGATSTTPSAGAKADKDHLVKRLGETCQVDRRS